LFALKIHLKFIYNSFSIVILHGKFKAMKTFIHENSKSEQAKEKLWSTPPANIIENKTLFPIGTKKWRTK